MSPETPREVLQHIAALLAAGCRHAQDASDEPVTTPTRVPSRRSISATARRAEAACSAALFVGLDPPHPEEGPQVLLAHQQHPARCRRLLAGRTTPPGPGPRRTSHRLGRAKPRNVFQAISSSRYLCQPVEQPVSRTRATPCRPRPPRAGDRSSPGNPGGCATGNTVLFDPDEASLWLYEAARDSTGRTDKLIPKSAPMVEEIAGI